MLRRLLFILFATLIGIFIVYLHNLPGSYAFFSLENISIETSLGVVCAVLIFAAAIAWVLWQCLHALQPARWKKLAQRIRDKNNRSRLNQALTAHFLGKHQQTRQLISKVGDETLGGFPRYAMQTDAKIRANHLFAAENLLQKADALAHTKNEKELALRLRAQWLFAKKDFATLANLAIPYRLASTNYWLQLQAIVAQKTGNTQKLLRILEKYPRHPDKIALWCALVDEDQANTAPSSQNFTTAHVWERAPLDVKHTLVFAQACLLRFAKEGNFQKTQSLLLHASQTDDLAPLLLYITYLPIKDKNTFLAKLEKIYALEGNKNEPLALALGRLCIQMQLWGKAKDYLEQLTKSNNMQLQQQANSALARLCIRTGNADQALAYLEQDTQPSLANLPLFADKPTQNTNRIPATSTESKNTHK